MTPDIQRVREAAERITAQPYGSFLNRSPVDYMLDDARLLANFALASVRAEDGEAVTDDWLRGAFGFRDDCCWESEDEDVEASLVDSGCYKCIEPNGVIIWCDHTGLVLGRDGETEAIVEFPVKTKGQFRQLAKALNIQPMEGEER